MRRMRAKEEKKICLVLYKIHPTLIRKIKKKRYIQERKKQENKQEKGGNKDMRRISF